MSGVRALVRPPAPSGREGRSLEALLRAVRARGVVTVEELDVLLDVDETRPVSTTERRFRRLLKELERVEVAEHSVPLGDPAEPGSCACDWVPRGALRLPDIQTYVAGFGRARVLDRRGEHALARRLEFLRRRFERALRAEGRSPAQARRALEEKRVGELLRNGLPRAAKRRLAEYDRTRREFVERNLHLVLVAVWPYRTYGVPLTDLVQEGNAGLVRAVEKFDWRRRVRFGTYAAFWIRQAVERAIAADKGIVRVPNYLQQKMRRLRREGVLGRRNDEVSVRDVAQAFGVGLDVAQVLLENERAPRSLDQPPGDDDEEPLGARLPSEPDEDADALLPAEKEELRRRVEEALVSLPEPERTILRRRFGLSGEPPTTLEEIGRELDVSRERVRQIQVRALEKLRLPEWAQRLADFV